MMNYWQQLKPRERMLITVGGGFFFVIILYLMILEPLTIKVDRLTVKVEKQKTEIQWLKKTAKEVKQLQRSGAGGSGSKRQGQSLLVIVDRTSKTDKLGKSISRIEPDGSSRVRVWLESASFDDLMNWLGTLERKYNVVVETAVIDKTASLGRVNARMVFVEGKA